MKSVMRTFPCEYGCYRECRLPNAGKIVDPLKKIVSFNSMIRVVQIYLSWIELSRIISLYLYWEYERSRGLVNHTSIHWISSLPSIMKWVQSKSLYALNHVQWILYNECLRSQSTIWPWVCFPLKSFSGSLICISKSLEVPHQSVT